MRYAYTFVSLVIVLSVWVGCVQRPIPTSNPTKYQVIRHDEEKELLRKEIAKISENDTFPTLVESIQKSVNAPNRIEFFKADSEIREKYTHKPSQMHIRYYYLIRIHYRVEDTPRWTYQDYELYPDGDIHAIEKQ